MYLNPNADFQYLWKVPDDHPQGLHWYHPHRCGLVEDQVLGGLSGFLIIDGLLEEQYPELVGIEERMFVFKDIQLPGVADSLPKTKTINGLSMQQIPIKPGEWQMWRLGNIGADAFIKLKVDGHKFWILAEDGNPKESPQEVSEILIVPSARTTALIQGGKNGVYSIRSMEVDTGPQGDPNPEIELGKLVVSGDPLDSSLIAERVRKPAKNPDKLGGTTDEVEKLPITGKSTITFTESADGKVFYINGKIFDENRTDVEVNLGDVEEWTVINQTAELHVFHIHQLDFLVTEIMGQTMDFEGLRDVIDVPYKQNGKPGIVKVIIPFNDPVIVGKFPFHCHILEHEDNGMMANLVVNPGK